MKNVIQLAPMGDVSMFISARYEYLFPKQRLRGGVLTFLVGKWAAVAGFFGAGGWGCGCGWGFVVPVGWLWLGCSGVGAVPMAGAGSCGCIF